jgi:hypothetical protein
MQHAQAQHQMDVAETALGHGCGRVQPRCENAAEQERKGQHRCLTKAVSTTPLPKPVAPRN